MSTARQRPAKARLGDLSDAVYSAICDLTPRQRRAAIRALEGLTETNCSWVLHRMRDVLLGFIDDASMLRQRKARARARGGKP